jgi:hypothetical protein
VKHDPYIHRFGTEIDFYVTTWRCKNCDAETSLGVCFLEEAECPNTGAPDWKEIDRKERDAGMKRFLKSAYAGLQDP